MSSFRSLWFVGLAFACSRSPGSEPKAAPAAASASAKPAPVASGGVAETTETLAGPVTAPAALPATTSTPEPPASFDHGRNESIGNAVGLGCEPRSSSGWLEILCRKKNGTGGHPVRASLHDQPGAGADSAAAAANDAGDAGDGQEVLADDRKELRVVLPFQAGKKSSATFEWTDTRYELALDGTQGSFTWAGIALPHRRECQALLDENQKRIAEAQKGDAPARVLAAEAHHLPKFGVCQPAGLGSFALSLTSFVGKGEGAARSLVFELAVVHVDLDGHRRARRSARSKSRRAVSSSTRCASTITTTTAATSSSCLTSSRRCPRAPRRRRRA